MKVKVQTLDGRPAPTSISTTTSSVVDAARRHPAPRRRPGSSRSAAARLAPLANAAMCRAPARSSVARRAAAPHVTAIATRRSSSAVARRMAPVPAPSSHSLNKKIRTLGLKMALSDKAKGGKLVVIDTLELKDAKTKALAGELGKLELRQPRALHRR